MKLLWSVLILVTLGLQYRLWIGEGSVTHVWQLQDAVELQKMENNKLSERNRKLDADVIDLKSGHLAIEERARKGLGMIGPNETFFLVVKADP